MGQRKRYTVEDKFRLHKQSHHDFDKQAPWCDTEAEIIWVLTSDCYRKLYISLSPQ